MSRLSSAVLLFGGAVLLMTWIVSPASSAPQTPAPPPAAPATAPGPLAAPVEPVRLPDPDAPAPEYRVPVRDPFSFSSRERPRRAASVVDRPVEPPAPLLPSLVAIVTDARPEGAVHRAALSDASGAVRIVGAGDTYGSFTVARIGGGSLALIDASTGLTYQLALR